MHEAHNVRRWRASPEVSGDNRRPRPNPSLDSNGFHQLPLHVTKCKFDMGTHTPRALGVSFLVGENAPELFPKGHASFGIFHSLDVATGAVRPAGRSEMFPTPVRGPAL